MEKGKVKAAFTVIFGQLKKVRGEYENTLAEIERVNGEINKLLNMPVSLADFSDFLKQSIQAEGEKYLAQIGQELLRKTHSFPPVNQWTLGFLDGCPLQDEQCSTGTVRNWLLNGISTNVSALNTFKEPHHFRRLICCMMPEKVHEAMMAAIAAQIGDKWGAEDLPAVAERRASIAAYREELAALETKRQELAAQLEELGQISNINP